MSTQEDGPSHTGGNEDSSQFSKACSTQNRRAFLKTLGTSAPLLVAGSRCGQPQASSYPPLVVLQKNRSGEKDLLQQFSTPPHYAYAVAPLANIDKNDVVLEPSAGTGGLTVQAIRHGASPNSSLIYVSH